MKFRFIKEHLSGQVPVGVACDVLEVSRPIGLLRVAGPPRRRAGGAPARELAGAGGSWRELAEKVRAVHAASRGVYGSPRVCAALRAGGEGVCENTAAKVMREQEIRAKAAKKKKYVPETREQARASTFEYIEVFYNRRRRHSSLGYLSPEQFEAGLN